MAKKSPTKKKTIKKVQTKRKALKKNTVKKTLARPDNAIFLGGSFLGAGHYHQKEYLLLSYANRHGLITGATGTGKTVTLQILAQGFSKAGIPVFCADIKGDLSGISLAGTLNDKIKSRLDDLHIDDFKFYGAPVIFWDVFQENGHPLRASVDSMGVLLLSRLLNLNSAQIGVLNIAFKLANDHHYKLTSLEQLQSVLREMSEHSSYITKKYGTVTKSSLGAVQRALLILEEQGADYFLGEPSLDLRDVMCKNNKNEGFVSILDAQNLMKSPNIYAAMLLWVLNKLFEELPEVGDINKPKLVFFFDEAHLLFKDTPKVFVDKVEQVVRLVRSKGVGIYFVTQSPADIPERILAQLGNRIQHSLRAHTPREIQAVKIAAKSFRENPNFDTLNMITSLSTGEALISTLDNKAIPQMVQKTLIRPPSSQIGPISMKMRQILMNKDPIADKYDRPVKKHIKLFTLDIPQTASSSNKTAIKQRNLQGIGEVMGKTMARSLANRFGKTIARTGDEAIRAIVKSFLNRKK